MADADVDDVNDVEQPFLAAAVRVIIARTAKDFQPDDYPNPG